MDEGIILSFVRTSIKSAWSLEVLLLLARAPETRWSTEALVRELRGSVALVVESLASLDAKGLIAQEDGMVRFRPGSPEQAALVEALGDLYAQKPAMVLRTIFTSPNDTIRSFSDAFLFGKK